MDSLVPTTSKEAKSRGLKTYFTGNPCKRGGVAERRLNGDCLCDKCTEFVKKLKANWSNQNSEKAKVWRAQNPEKMAQYKKEWAERNRKKAAESIKKWKERNKHKISAYVEKRRAAKMKCLPCWNNSFDSFVFEESARIARLRSKVTGIKWSVDHMLPLQADTVCGLHSWRNLQVIPSTLNFSKANKMVYTEPLEWIRYL